MTVWEMNKLLKDYPHRLFRDKIWKKLNDTTLKIMEQSQSSANYHYFIFNRYEMCRFLMEEMQHWGTALTLLAEGVYYDFHLERPHSFVFMYNNYKRYGISEGEDMPVLHLDIDKTRFYTLQEELGLSDDELHSRLLYSFHGFFIPEPVIARYGIPLQVFSDEEIADFICAEILDDANKSNSIRTQVEQRLKMLRCPII